MAEAKEVPEARHTHVALSCGLYFGAGLTIVMLASLVAANRIPVLERYALERNGIAYGLFLTIMLYPVLRFFNRPLQLFGSAMTGWVMFAAAYDLAGIYFHNLSSVLRTPLEVLVGGAIIYGVCAVGAWVVAMGLCACRQEVAPDRRRAHDEAVPHGR